MLVLHLCFVVTPLGADHRSADVILEDLAVLEFDDEPCEWLY
jgi:hypothetical protein